MELMSEKRGNWIRLSSKVVHRNPFYLVKEDTVIKPDSSRGFYHVVEGKDSVFIVALDERQNVHLVGLHRYTNNNFSIEVPSGGTDGQELSVAAKRELKEETGLIANEWKQIGVIHPANGFMRKIEYVFLATDLNQTNSNKQKEEGIEQLLILPFKKALQMVKSGEITDAQSIASLTLAALELGLIGN